MDYMTTKAAAEKWAITPCRVQVLCVQGKLSGVFRSGATWAIPKNMVKPEDGRIKKLINDWRGDYGKLTKRIFGFS